MNKTTPVFLRIFTVHMQKKMSDLSSELSFITPRHNCECYKKLQTYGIPLYINDENDFYSENQKIIPYENAFQLPGFLEINEDVVEYPVIDDNEMSYVFQQMVAVIPKLADFEQNVLSFWILDMFIEGLWTAQGAKMNFQHQKATLLWIAYFYNYIQKQNPARNDLFHHLKIILFQRDIKESGDLEEETCSDKSETEENTSSKKTTKTWDLPLPPEFKIKQTQNDIKQSSISEAESNSVLTDSEEEIKSTATSDLYSKNKESTTETNLTNMKIILDILYRIFARFWVYLEIQTVFHAMPPVEQVNLPFTLRIPKPLLKSKPPTPVKPEKSSKRPIFSEKSSEEIESERLLHKNDYILPLKVAEEAKLYMKQMFSYPASQKSVLGKGKEEKLKK